MSSQLERSGVIHVANRPYAVGLFWQTAEDSKNARREAKIAARQEAEPADLLCVREGFVTQWAIGWTKAGHTPGMPAAASAIGEDVSGNWLGVFEIEGGGWWFVAARRDAILPDGDMLYDNEDEPRARFEREFARGGWDRVFTPAYWGIGGDTTELADILGKVSANARLKPVGGALGSLLGDLSSNTEKRNRVVMASVILIALLTIPAVTITVMGKWAEVWSAVTGDSTSARPTQRAELVIRRWERPEARPWAFAPKADIVVQLCMEKLQESWIIIPNWNVQSVSCDLSSNPRLIENREQMTHRIEASNSLNYNVSWQRAPYGTVAGARAAISAAFPEGAGPEPSVGQNEVSIGQMIPQGQEDQLRPREEEDPSLSREDELQRDIWDLFQSVNIEARMNRITRPQTPGVPPEQQLPHATHYELVFSTMIPPKEWIRDLAAKPGVVLNRIEYDVSTRQWSYNFKLFYRTSDVEDRISALGLKKPPAEG